MRAPGMANVTQSRPSLLLDILRQRPELLLYELSWRWLCGTLLLMLAGFDALRVWHAALPALHATGMLTLTKDSIVEEPSVLLDSFSAAAAILEPPLVRAVLGLLPLACFCWIAAFALGRTAMLASYDARLPSRPWFLAGCQACKLSGGIALGLLWTSLIEAAGMLLRGEAPSLLLYLLLITGLTVAALLLWGQLAGKVQATMALGLVEGLSISAALRRAFELPDALLMERAKRFRQAARKTRLYTFGPAFLISLLPSPFHGRWLLLLWYGLLSLVPLAASNAARLGAFLALIREIREELAERAAAMPGVSAERIRL